MESLRFADQVRDLEVDAEACRTELAARVPADRCYVIVFTPRSGSSWLTSVLSATGVLSQPEEFINEGFVRVVAKATNSTNPQEVLAILKRRRRSRTGVFGIEATSTHIDLFGENEFFEAFRMDTIFFHLWRDNIVAQGISLYRAIATQRFHVSDPEVSAPDYNGADIQQWIKHLSNIENENRRMLDRQGYVPRVIRYEDIVRSRDTTAAIFADAMRVTLPEAPKQTPAANEFQKVGDDWNTATEVRFRTEERQFVDDIEAQRLIRKL